MNFLGILCGNCDCKLQHIVQEENGRMVQKTSEILLWFAFTNGRQSIYIPMSKFDIENNNMVVLSQIYSAINDRTRSIVRKTREGSTIIPYGAIIEK